MTFLTKGSSIGDVSSLGHPVLPECVMADVQGLQPVPVEIGDTHGGDLRQRQEHWPPPASIHTRRNSEPNARDVSCGTQAHTRQV
jgi:hypothetical protein